MGEPAIMKYTRLIMGMPITIEVVDAPEGDAIIEDVFAYFQRIDERFSTYKPDSEISRINRGELKEKEWSDDMHIVFMLAEETKQRSHGFFDIRHPKATSDGKTYYDPSGIVKGWAIWNAAQLITERGFLNFFVDAGGDVQTSGKNFAGDRWSVGIRHPFQQDATVKTVFLSGEGIATSGTYIRGAHIYNPKTGNAANEIASITVIGPNVYEADRFATAAFVMGGDGIRFIETLPDLEGYAIDANGVATITRGFEKYLH